MTRLDLTLKMTGADGSESIEHRTVEIPDHPDAGALHRVFHVLHTELRVTAGDQALPRQNERARLVEILGQAREHHALFRYPQCADDVAVWALIKVEDLVLRLLHESIGGDLVNATLPDWERPEL